MASQTSTVSQVAKELGVSASTVRRLCDDFSERLSDSAKRVEGGPRRFTARDVEVLKEAIKLKSEGLSVSTINERLGETVYAAPLTESPQATPDAPGRDLALTMVSDTLRSVETRLQAIEQRIAPIETQRLRVDVAFLVVAGFIAGLILGLAVWWFQ